MSPQQYFLRAVARDRFLLLLLSTFEFGRSPVVVLIGLARSLQLQHSQPRARPCGVPVRLRARCCLPSSAPVLDSGVQQSRRAPFSNLRAYWRRLAMALCTRSALPGGLAVACFVVHVVLGVWLNPMHEGLLGGQVALDASPLPGSPSTRVTGGVIGIRPILLF